MTSIANPVQGVTITRLPRPLYADLNYFAALHGVRLQTIGRLLIIHAATHPDMMPDLISRGLEMKPQPGDTKLQLPFIPREAIQIFYRLAGKQVQPALRGLFDWMAENGEVVLGMVKRE